MGPSWKRFSSKVSLKDDRKDGKSNGLGASAVDITPMESVQSFHEELLSDLQQLIQDHEHKIQEQSQIIKLQQNSADLLKDDEKILQDQLWALSDQLNASKAEAEALRKHISTLENQELKTRSNTIQILSIHNQVLQKRVVDLEQVVAVASNNTGIDFQHILSRNAEAEKSLNAATSRLKAAEDSQSQLQATIQEMEYENSQLQDVVERMKQEASVVHFSQPQTLRSLLIVRFIDHASTIQTDIGDAETEQQVHNWSPTGLPPNTFDKICSPTEIQSLANLLPKGPVYDQFYKRLRLDFCSLCSKPKFRLKAASRPDHASVKWLNEYIDSSRYFPCCYEKVCRDCFKGHLLEVLEHNWWFKLGTPQWFPCPMSGCGQSLGIRCEADLHTCLERNCSTDAEEHIKMYTKAMAFRQALETLDPRPDDDVLKKASQLTQHLVRSNRMYSLFDSRFDPVLVDETGCIPDFEPGKLFSAVMDGQTSPVPLFLKFLRRQTTQRTCMACSKAMFEIDYGDVEIWKIICEDFQGSWMWNMLVFPTSEIQQCDHDLEICRTCTAEHIRGTLVSGGPSACDNLTCPQCRRQLSYNEVIQLADAETVAKYEKFLVQDFLSKEPNFRWCLSPLCENGQLYENIPYHKKTSCEICNYEMCFKHEVPWHEGLTCDQYESQREHGDPSFGETREWIRTNTKPCPGCQVGIQKGEACFHMTCSQCNHQFCWQCLADWQEIRTRGQEGHGDGCFFRTNDVRPTGVRGENLQQALQGRNM